MQPETDLINQRLKKLEELKKQGVEVYPYKFGKKHHARQILEKYNKIARGKIDFGISVNSGDMIIRKDGNMMKFMGLGNVINTSKKVKKWADEKHLKL